MDTSIKIYVENGIIDIAYERGKVRKRMEFSTCWIKIPLYVVVIISLLLWIS